MKSNPLLKWLLIPMALVLLFVGIKMFSGDRGAKPVPAGSANSLTPEEMKALGIEGDTPRDTVATLVAQVKQLRNELQTALNDNKNQKSENERMRARVTGRLHTDSRQVREGDGFIAWPGAATDGRRFVAGALAARAGFALALLGTLLGMLIIHAGGVAQLALLNFLRDEE